MQTSALRRAAREARAPQLPRIALALGRVQTDLGDSVGALAAFESRRRPRTDWVRAQTHRRDRTRKLPAAARNIILRTAGPRILRANYGPLLADP